MATVTLGKACDCPECADIRSTVEGAFRKAEHVVHKARALKTVAEDAVEERVVEAAHRIRKSPFRAVGIAFAIGVPVGALLGWACGHSAHVSDNRRDV